MLKEKLFVLLEFKDIEDLFERQIDIIIGASIFGSTGGECPFLSRVAFDGGSGLLDHVMMDSLTLSLLPVLHLIILLLESQL